MYELYDIKLLNNATYTSCCLYVAWCSVSLHSKPILILKFTFPHRSVSSFVDANNYLTLYFLLTKLSY